MSNEQNRASDGVRDSDQRFRSHFGVVDFAFDVIGRIGPGLVFLTLMALCCYSHPESFHGIRAFLDGTVGDEHWAASWPMALLILVVVMAFAYFAGQLADCLFSWWFLDLIVARGWYSRLRAKKGNDETNKSLPSDWDGALEKYSTDPRPLDEKLAVRKVQIESRACVNLGVLLLGYGFVVLGVSQILAYGFLSVVPWQFWKVGRLPYIVAGLLFVLAGCLRQRRRVRGVYNILIACPSADTNKPATGAAGSCAPRG